MYTKTTTPPKDKSICYIPIDKAFLLEDPDSPSVHLNQIYWILHAVSCGYNLRSFAPKNETGVRIIKEIYYIERFILSVNDTLSIPSSNIKTNFLIP